jgi:Maltose acetyltransferase
MRSERDKMLAGELYDPMDAELVRARDRARDLCQDLNATREAQIDERRRILKEPNSTGLQVLKCRVSGQWPSCHPSSYQGRGCENGRSTEDPASPS